MNRECNILIVEDNICDLDLCIRELKKSKDIRYNLNHQKSGKDISKNISKYQIDCVLLDYSLPGENGMEILSQIKIDHPDTPVIILTRQGNESLAVKIMKNGAQDYVNKSLITSNLLQNSISDAISKCKLKQKQSNESKAPALILIVDDNIDDADQFIYYLDQIKSNKYKYKHLSDAKEAFDFIENNRPDCILLEYSLPGLNGLRILKQLKEKLPFVPIIMVTGQGDEKIAVEAIKNGAHHYLVKSDIGPDILFNSIKSGVEQTSLQMKIIEKDQKIQEREKQLAYSKEFLELIIESNPDLIFVKNEDFQIMECNTPFLNLYPKDKQDKIIGYTTIEEYPKDVVEEFLKMDKLAFDTGYSEVREEITFPDGKRRTLHTRKIRFKDLNGQKFILGIGRDISETEELIQKLTESNEELEKFAYIASHDLQEPLRMVSNFTQLLEKKLQGQLSNECKKYMDITCSAATRMQSLIQDLLDYAKCDKNSEELKKVSLDKTVEYVLKNLSESIRESNATITHNNLPTIEGNNIRIASVIQNLISNAIKYKRNDIDPKIVISSLEKPEHWEICIEDNGLGMKQEYCKQIFLPFKRLHSSSEFKGTGIGLAICAKIIKKMGGDIWVTSKPNMGSKFYFSLPKTMPNN